MCEEWRPVVGYEGCYEVSDQGRVRSLPRRKASGCIRKLSLKRNGYFFVELWRDGCGENCYVHRLVAFAFCERKPGCDVVRHLDGNPLNNTPGNLAWGTPSENSYDTVRHGRNRQAARTHCIHGHEFTPTNTITKRGGRNCRTCTYESNRKSRPLIGLRTHCNNGHEYTAANTYHHGGKRYCRACRRRNVAAYERRQDG